MKSFLKTYNSVFTKILFISVLIAIGSLILILSLVDWIISELSQEGFFSKIIFSINDEIILNILITIIAIFSLFIISYIIIRYILTPLSVIHKGVIELSKGNLDFQLPIKTKDEFGSIIFSFNQMIKRIASLLEAKQQLLLNLSHELRTPITRAQLSLELLKSNEKTQDIKKDLKEIEFIINSILETEKITKKKPVPKLLNLDKTIKKIISYHLKTNLNINYKSYLIQKEYKLDYLSLKILLNNLIQNSIKYSKTNFPIIISCCLEDSKIKITVKDKGIGIDSNEIEKLFDPFYTVEKSRSKEYVGYGLGLNICKKIVDNNNGAISITSCLGKGTTVLVELSI